MRSFWRSLGIVLLVCSAGVCFGGKVVGVAYPGYSDVVDFGIGRLVEALEDSGVKVERNDLSISSGKVDVVVTGWEWDRKYAGKVTGLKIGDVSVGAEGFEIRRVKQGGKDVLCILGGGEKGAMYGAMDAAEQIRMYGGLDKVKEKISDRRFEFRAIKFNLPWASYRSNEALSLHTETCQDIKFWEKFLDMMAENRFNALTLWNRSPFAYMVHTKGFEKGRVLSKEELVRWQKLWRGIFAMAKERGIETYIVNWSIVVPKEFARAYGVKHENDTSQLVRDYTRESIAQVIDEYPDLTGVGVTQADWMEEMSARERAVWVQETFIAGIKQAKRKAKFIYRSVRTGSPDEMRRVIDEAGFEDPVTVEIKFNWSHGHSTEKLAITHDYESGKIDRRFWDPAPKNFKIAWMIRNEDFFILRWGVGGFIRDHIAENGDAYVGGYFVGSETYIPAKDYSHVASGHVSWEYAFEKQWLFYMLWGRLLYDPDTSDEVFAAEFARRYGKGVGEKLLKAYGLASKMPLRLASFHAATWDFTLYSEGFLAAAQSRGKFDRVSPFISIDELIGHETLDPRYVSIGDHVAGELKGKKFGEEHLSPIELARMLELEGQGALDLVKSIEVSAAKNRQTLECEIADVKAWANLGLYFSRKIRGGVGLEFYRKTKDPKYKTNALVSLGEALGYWDNVIDATKGHYKAVASVHLGPEKFSWERFRGDVLRDIEIVENAQ